VGGQSDENKTFHHFEETGSDLKMTDFQEKSSGPKKLNSRSQACPASIRD
jgi:hypothetical protein